MSFKPCRGSGILFEKHYKNAEKYRMMFYVEIDILTFESLKKASKYLFYWLNNENKISSQKRTVENSVIRVHYERLKRNEKILYPKLLKLLNI